MQEHLKVRLEGGSRHRWVMMMSGLALSLMLFAGKLFRCLFRPTTEESKRPQTGILSHVLILLSYVE